MMTRSATPPILNWPLPVRPITNAGMSVAMETASCNGTPTFVTIVRTRSIMRDAAHAVFKRGPRVILPGIAVAAAYRDVVFTQFIDQRNRAGQFWSERDPFDHVAVLKQRLVHPTSRFSDQTRALRTRLRLRDEWTFDVDAGDL